MWLYLNRALAGALCLIFLTSLAACSLFHDPDQPRQLTGQSGPSAFPIDGVSTATLLPASNYYLLTTRPGFGVGAPPVLCSEPSPDFAIAFGNTLKAGANGGNGGLTAGVTGEADNTQAITAAAGRTAGVVALRDGLYSACQAYANGLIGKDAYALILSQYGNLLVALASGSSASAAGGGVAEMQQQAVQAMLVACLTYEDASGGATPPNGTLDVYCPIFMNRFMAALPALLKPPAAAPPPASKPVAQAPTAKPTQVKPAGAAKTL